MSGIREFAMAKAAMDAMGAITKGDVVNNLTSTATDKPLSANMGKALNEAITQSTAMGTWTPKLYDYETFICDMPACNYFKIGKLCVAEWHWNIPSETNITISTMLQVRNIPFTTVWGGNVYFAGTQSSFGNLTIQGFIIERAYPRPNWTGTMTSGWFTGLVIGMDDQ